jgi:hypothetical protein
MPVLPDPMRRRRRYVLCLVILGNKQLTSCRVVIIRSLLFGVTYPGPQVSEAASGSVFRNCGAGRCHGGLIVVHLGRELLWEWYWAGVSNHTTPPPTLSTFVERNRDVTRSEKSTSIQKQKIRGQP